MGQSAEDFEELFDGATSNGKKQFDNSNEVGVLKTSKAVLQVDANLYPAETFPGMLIAGNEKKDGKSVKSLIKITIVNKTENGTTTVYDNMTPDAVCRTLDKIKSEKDFRDSTDKIFGVPDEKGYSIVKKMSIQCMSKTTGGEVAKYPFGIIIETGKGIPVKNDTGGTFCKPGSFVSEAKCVFRASRNDITDLFNRTEHVIRAFETAVMVKRMLGK